MSDPADLYQTYILEHARNPRNAHIPEHADRRARRDNPLCGDRIELGLAVRGDVITETGFRGRGCAIAQASASLMTEAIRSKTVAQTRALAEAVHALVRGQAPADAHALGDLIALGGVAAFPMRIRCATLAWEALAALLDAPADAAGSKSG